MVVCLLPEILEEELVGEIGLGGRARTLCELSSRTELSRDAGATGLGT